MINVTPLNQKPRGQIEVEATNGFLYHYYQTDHLGTPLRMTTATGIISWQTQASAFGDSKIDMQIASTRLAAENNHRFPGQYYDAETGLHQNYFRDYEASIGRYVQRDPIGLDGGINVFGYVGAGPIGGIDVYGLFTTGPDIPKKRKGGHPYCEGKSLIAEIWGFSRCIEDCAIVHEERHLPDIMSKNPTLCHSVPEFDKKVVSASTQQEKDWTERNAYTAELKCLEEKEKKLCEDSNCRATVWRRIRFVEDILESEGW